MVRGCPGIPESSVDTRGPLRTAVPWRDRFRRFCGTAMENYFRSQERGRGSRGEERPPWVGRFSGTVFRNGVAGAGADRKPRASTEAEVAFLAGRSGKGCEGGLNRAAQCDQGGG